MRKEQAKPADEPINYSAFKDRYVKITSGADRIEYSARVIDLYHNKITLNLADGTERKIDINYIHSISPIEKPLDFKQISPKTEAKKGKAKKKEDALNFPEIEEKNDKNEEKDDENNSLEGIVSKDE
jgi:hypothetical protein